MPTTRTAVVATLRPKGQEGAARRTRGLPPVAQRGAALLVALILLVVITLVGLAAMSTTILQNKAAANQYDRQIAFQAAEAALRQGEVDITTHASAGTPAPAGIVDCSTPAGATQPNTLCGSDPFNDANVPPADILSVQPSVYSAGPLAAMPPQYVVEYMGQFVAPSTAQVNGGLRGYGAPPPTEMAPYYRITARSGDPSNPKVDGRSVVTLQSTFRD